MKKFDSNSALNDVEILIKKLTNQNTLSGQFTGISAIKNYLESIYNKGLADGFEQAERTNNLKL